MTELTRRTLFKGAAGLATSLIAPTGLMAFGAAATPTPQRVVDEQPFAQLVEVGDGLFAAISTPLDVSGRFSHSETVCNGGLIVGDDRIVAVDAFYRPIGAEWLNSLSKKLLGRPVSDVICTHVHLDHTGGLAGFQDGATGPEIYMTAKTWDLMVEKYSAGRPIEGSSMQAVGARLVGPSRLIPEDGPTRLDLGGRSIIIEPLAGHTPSDLAVSVEGEPVVYGGDLVWWGLFPNYVDAVPSKLAPAVKHLLTSPNRLVITGHGGLVMAGEAAPYLQLIESIDTHAHAARADGLTPAEAADRFTMPASTRDWAFFNPRYPETAFMSWYREWGMA